jgi:hypothetical protein
MCDYSLEGLPAEYSCPECGSPYDRQTMVWVQEDRWAARRKYAPYVGIAMILIWTFCIFLTIGEYPIPMSLVFNFFIMILSVVYSVVASMTRSDRTIFFAVGIEGIYRTDGAAGKTQFIIWDRVKPIDLAEVREKPSVQNCAIGYDHVRWIFLARFEKDVSRRITMMELIEARRSAHEALVTQTKQQTNSANP